MNTQEIELPTFNAEPSSDFTGYGGQRPQEESIKDSAEINSPSQLSENKKKIFSIRSEIENANILSLLHFSFGFKLVRFVNSFKKKRTLTVEDLGPSDTRNNAEAFEKAFTEYYYELSKQYKGKKRVMALAMFKIFQKDFFIQLFWQLLFAISRILLVYFLYRMLASVKTPTDTLAQAYRPAVGMFIFSLVGHYANHQLSFHATYVVNNIRLGILGMMFRKLNRLSLYAVHKMNLGKVINLVANDGNNLDRVYFLISIVLAPFILGGGVGILLYFWGTTAFVGVFYMLFTWIFQYLLSNYTLKIRRSKSGQTDSRIEFLIESFEAIRLIKVNAWEYSRIDQVKKIRAEETKLLKRFNYIDSIARAVALTSNHIGAFLIFVVDFERTGIIPPVKIFPTILLMTFLRQLCMIQVSQGFLCLVELRLLFTRTMSIMDLPEVQPTEIFRTLNPENAVEYKNFTGYWVNKNISSEQKLKKPKHPQNLKPIELADVSTPVISNINLQIKTQTLTAIIGKIGSGKSSLMLSLSGEMSHVDGELRCTGSYAYVAQEPVFFAGSLKDAITFGKTYDEELFWAVVDACCLTDDVKKHPHQEMSEIGEKGVNLGIRMKAQVALARALYLKADIYLLDDPLAGLNPRLANLLFKKAIKEFLKSKTVVLITHQLRFVKDADLIVVMDNGEIAAQGSYEDLTKQNDDEYSGSNVGCDTKSKINALLRKVSNQHSKDKKLVERANIVNDFSKEEDDSDENILSSEQDEGLFIEDKQLDEGYASLKVYWKYFSTVFNWFTILPITLLFVGSESISWLFMVLMGKWGRQEYSSTTAYAVISPTLFGVLFAQLLKLFLYYSSTLNASLKLHNKMLDGVFQSPVIFFDTNNVGKIISRFSNDIGILDKFLVASLLELLEGFCLFMVFLITLWVREPWILLPASTLAVFYIVIFAWSKRTLDQSRALELRTRAPLYSIFVTTVSGLITIRRRGQCESMMKTYYNKLNDYSKANTAYFVSTRVMTFLIDYVTELTVIITFCFFIHAKGKEITSGLFVNMLTLLPTTLQWILKNFIVFRLYMANTARVINYCKNYRKVPLERVDDDKHRSAEWPQAGEINIKDVDLKFSEKSDFTLLNLSAAIQAREKVAIIGNSRGSLSAFSHMMLRTFEIDGCSDKDSHIIIDKVNTKHVGLHLLRKSITVLPQEVYLFTTTIRNNIDPLQEYKDEQLWNVLEEVGLKDLIMSLKKKMNTRLSKGRSIFSVGQRHMLSIARGFLKNKSKILIQDDATVHVDIWTEEVVQRRTREIFKDATMFTKTTRLWTIADYDRVFVMKAGVQTEFDEPYRLLVNNIGDTQITNKSSYFANLVLNMGSYVATQTLLLAMEAYYRRHNISFPVNQIKRSLPKMDENYHSLENVHVIETAVDISNSGEEQEVYMEDIPHKRLNSLENNQIQDIQLEVLNEEKGIQDLHSAPIQHLMLRQMKPQILRKLIPTQFKGSKEHHEQKLPGWNSTSRIYEDKNSKETGH